jgi:hypothetical protein
VTGPRSAAVRTVPARVAVPFLLAAAGVLLMIGAVLTRVLGPWGLAAYLLLLIAPVGYAAVVARRRATRRAAGHSCTCCTGTVHDPVQVI